MKRIDALDDWLTLEQTALDEAFAFDGERCDRIVAKVLERIASGT